MDIIIDQQVAMDEALVPHAHRLRIRRSNFRLLSDISSKESTLHLVYDVLHLTPFFKAFLVTADILEIYMQEFWATATVHHHYIRFKMDNKKHNVNLESFREMLHICPRLPGQSFVEPPFEEEILAFLHFLGHSGAIKRLTDAMIAYNYLKLEFFGGYTTRGMLISLILCGKSSSIRLNIKIQRRAMRCIILGATPPKPKASIRKTRSSSDTTVTPPTAVAGPRLSTSAKGKQPATTSKAKSLSALSEVAMTEAQQLKLSTKRSLQQTHISQASGFGADKGTGTILGVPDEDERNDEDDQEESTDDEQASEEKYFINPSLSTHAEEETRDEESFDPISKTPENTDGEGNGEENLEINVGRDEGQDEADKEDELYRDVNINLGREEPLQGLVEAYESDKIILDTYGDTITLKRHRDDDADKDEEPSDGSDRGSKRRREGKELESASAPREKATRSAGNSTQGSKSRQTSASESAIAKEPMQTTFEMEEPSHPEFETGADD
nr:hypothetical protein [Tanacetum cinerariifolium]